MSLVKERIAGTIPDTLLLLTHPPVYTIGRAGTRKHILVSDAVLEREGLAVHEVDRGGDITYHGPGQLVGYPILDLQQHGKDLHKLSDQYEEVIIRVLGEYGIKAGRIPECPGVWVGQEKICALGIGVTKWVSYHGWALNINPDMTHFGYITPCGIIGKGVTSLKNLLGRDVTMEEIVPRVVKSFGEVFNLEMIIKWS
jgi:lipoate-protein ligase B